MERGSRTFAQVQGGTFRVLAVGPGYFTTLKIPLLAGRDFTNRDTYESPRVVIINEAMAQHYWPGQDAVGRKMFVDGDESTVIGVVRTGKYRTLTEAPEPFLYRPAGQASWQLDMCVCVRASGGAAIDPAVLAGKLRDEIHRLDPGVEVWCMLPLSGYIEAAALPQTIASSLLTLLGLIALVLSAMGVYAVMGYAVSQRTQEFGIRFALGASQQTVLWQVARQGLTLAALGIAAGLLLAFGGTRLLAGFLYGVSPFDVVTFTAVPLLLLGIALLASLLPARRASRVDPIVALRAE